MSLTRKQSTDSTGLRTSLFKGSFVGAASIAVAGLALAFPAHSQTVQESADEAEIIEEIRVTGIRRSLAAAVDLKRNAESIVDAIVAEDIGRFSDENAAESLARVTGVTVTRSSGEGALVSVRGVDPGLTNMSLNGQTQGSTQDDGREFDFSMLSSELIGAIEVVKSPTADMEEGGIGATINVRTRRALDFKDRQLAVTGYADYSDLAEQVDPRGSILWADRFADDRFGVLLNVTAQQRTVREDAIRGWGWRTRGTQDFQTLNRIRYTSTTSDRKRAGATLSLQFQPTDRSELYFDTVYNELDDDKILLYQEPTLYPRYATPAEDQLDENRTLVASSYANLRYSSNVQRQPIELSNRSSVLGGSTYLGDWEVSTEFAQMKAERSWRTLKAAASSNQNFDADYELNGVLPYLTYFERGASTPIDPADSVYYTDTRLQLRDQLIDVEDEKSLGQLDFERELDAGFLNRLQFGIKYKESNKSRRKLDTQNIRYTVSDLSAYNYQIVDDHLRGADFTDAGQSLANFDIDRLTNDLTTAVGATPFVAVEDINQFYDVEEVTKAIYSKIDFATMAGGVEVLGNLGIRYVSTDLLSKGLQTVGGVDMDVRRSHSYSDTLPSFNVALRLTNELYLRAAAAKVMSRPRLSDLTARETVDVNTNGDITIKKGNVTLDPYRADQFDLSLEWYFEEGSILSLALFYKDVESFIFSVRDTTDNGDGTFTTFIEPRNDLDGATVKGVEMSYQYAFDALPSPFDGLGVQLNYTYQESDALFESDDSTVNLGLPGLSKNSYNAVVYYEKERFGARLAYNFRGNFLEDPSGRQNNVIYTTDYGQLDSSFSFEVTDRFGVKLDIVNLLEEEVYQYGDFQNRLYEYQQHGRRYHLGFSYKL